MTKCFINVSGLKTTVKLNKNWRYSLRMERKHRKLLSLNPGINETFSFNLFIHMFTPPLQCCHDNFYSAKMTSRFESVTDYERNLSPMILIANQTVYSWNKRIILRLFCPRSNNFPRLKAQEIIWFWTKQAWNYSLISLVTIWLLILVWLASTFLMPNFVFLTEVELMSVHISHNYLIGWTMVFKLNGRRNTESTMTYRQVFEDPRGVEENNAEVLSTKWNQGISGYKSRIMTRMVFPTFNASKVSATESKFEILWIEFSFF